MFQFKLTRSPSSNTERLAISNQISANLKPYSLHPDNQDREDHIYELCGVGSELQELMSAHPSSWTFGELDRNEGLRTGFITVLPPLLKDGDQVTSRQFLTI